MSQMTGQTTQPNNPQFHSSLVLVVVFTFAVWLHALLSTTMMTSGRSVEQSSLSSSLAMTNNRDASTPPPPSSSSSSSHHHDVSSSSSTIRGSILSQHWTAAAAGAGRWWQHSPITKKQSAFTIGATTGDTPPRSTTNHMRTSSSSWTIDQRIKSLYQIDPYLNSNGRGEGGRHHQQQQQEQQQQNSPPRRQQLEEKSSTKILVVNNQQIAATRTTTVTTARTAAGNTSNKNNHVARQKEEGCWIKEQQVVSSVTEEEYDRQFYNVDDDDDDTRIGLEQIMLFEEDGLRSQQLLKELQNDHLIQELEMLIIRQEEVKQQPEEENDFLEIEPSLSIPVLDENKESNKLLLVVVVGGGGGGGRYDQHLKNNTDSLVDWDITDEHEEEDEIEFGDYQSAMYIPPEEEVGMTLTQTEKIYSNVNNNHTSRLILPTDTIQNESESLNCNILIPPDNDPMSTLLSQQQKHYDQPTTTDEITISLSSSLLHTNSLAQQQYNNSVEHVDGTPESVVDALGQHTSQSSSRQLKNDRHYEKNKNHDKPDWGDHSLVEEEEEDNNPVSMRLPIDPYVDTLEGRFTRRRWQRRRRAQLITIQSTMNHIDQDTENPIVEQQQKDTLSTPDMASTISTTSLSSLAQLSWTGSIPDWYFTNPNLDDTVRVLSSLPWHFLQQIVGPLDDNAIGKIVYGCDHNHHVNDSDAADRIVMWDEYMTIQLCELDGNLQQLNKVLSKQVQLQSRQLPNAGMDKINLLTHEWERSLRLAELYWHRSYECIQLAMHGGCNNTTATVQVKDAPKGIENMEEETSLGGLVGAHLLLESCQQRETYRHLEQILKEIDNVQDIEEDIRRRIDTFRADGTSSMTEFLSVLQISDNTVKNLIEGSLCRVQALCDVQARLEATSDRFHGKLLALAQNAASQCCRHPNGWDPSEYEQLVHAMTALKSRSVGEQEPPHQEGMVVDAWSDSLVTAFLHEADRALAFALLEPTNSTKSKHNDELRKLEYELSLDWGDTAKLKTVTHNLVTIRFDFESETNHFPGVVHRLCMILTDVLHAYSLLHKWHSKPLQDERAATELLHIHQMLQSTLLSLTKSRQIVWEHCIMVISKCLHEHLHFSAKRQLYQKIGNDEIDDSLWAEDLDGLHTAFIFIERFLAVKSDFFDSESKEEDVSIHLDKDSNPVLYRNLMDVFRKNLRSTHVEAMKSLGRRLASETWVFSSVTLSSTVNNTLCLEELWNPAIGTATSESAHRPTCRNHFSSADWPVATFGQDCKQSHSTISSIKANSAQSPPHEANACLPASISEPLCELIKQKRVASESVTACLVPWICRLLLTMEKLPLIIDDASAVCTNLFDLYLTTVFRICSGSGIHERLLLGIHVPQQNAWGEQPVPTQRFGSFGKGAGSVKPVKKKFTIPGSIEASIEAEMCGPTFEENEDTMKLRNFVVRAQQSLVDFVNLDMVDNWITDPTGESLEEEACKVARVLEKRMGALWNCFTVASIAAATVSAAQERASRAFYLKPTTENMSLMKAHAQKMLEVVPSLVRRGSLISCMRAISGRSVVEQILQTDSGWEECKLNEDPNEYVDQLCERMALILGYMSTSSKLPHPMLKSAWDLLVAAGYMAMLEGFARVPFCTTEGRALMALDLASFTAGTKADSIAERLESHNMAAIPPIASPAYGMRLYVDTYIKAFYYPLDEIMIWVRENYKRYRLHHVLALASGSSNSLECSREAVSSLKMIIDEVESLYTRAKSSRT